MSYNPYSKKRSERPWEDELSLELDWDEAMKVLDEVEMNESVPVLRPVILEQRPSPAVHSKRGRPILQPHHRQPFRPPNHPPSAAAPRVLPQAAAAPVQQYRLHRYVPSNPNFATVPKAPSVVAPTATAPVQRYTHGNDSFSVPNTSPKPRLAADRRAPLSATAVASIRPASWNRPKPHPPSPPKVALYDPKAPDARQAHASLPKELQFDPDDVLPVHDGFRQPLIQNAGLNDKLRNGWTLFPHQKRAIVAGLVMRRKILALDMGLGKTLIGCCWAKAFIRTMNVRAIVIAPVSLKKEWKRTAQDIVGITAGDERKLPFESEIVIASWGRIPGLIDEEYVVVADEAHCMQSMAATRTQDALRLMERARGVLLLTGTPMKNGKAANLFPLLKAVRHPFGNHQRVYERFFCNARFIHVARKEVWQATGASNLEILGELTKSHILHLSKEDCLDDLPPQTRIIKKVPVSSRAHLQHTEALQRLAKVYASYASQEAILGAVQNLRLVDSFAKVDATVEVAKQVLQKEAAVVIFTSFVKVASSVHKKLCDSGWMGDLLTGGTSANQRQEMVDKFQQGLSPFLVATFGAGGVGLTLTAAHTVILLDRPWTPGDAHQAEDRVRRIGQTKAVTSIWISSFELDEQIDKLLDQKNLATAAVLNSKKNKGGSEAGDAPVADFPKLSILKLLKSILPPSQVNQHLAATTR